MRMFEERKEREKMENQVAVYSFRGENVRTVKDKNGDVWFVAKDVAERLGVLWNGATSIAHVPEEWRGVLTVNTPSGRQSAITLSEQGLYFFLGRSDKPQALPFQKWIAGEVLPPQSGRRGHTTRPLRHISRHWKSLSPRRSGSR